MGDKSMFRRPSTVAEVRPTFKAAPVDEAKLRAIAEEAERLEVEKKKNEEEAAKKAKELEEMKDLMRKVC
jgi:uncharacterized protein (UPF0335 family)